ncbi:porin OmpC [Sodalis sp. dw_96]|uniref:porin OmpC n=1 Tax=Sodalis sp. dw_96 TaxID=2719794 RepID=UPI001BD30363|nr:porin OmpC [Sodalis sp. dw_96]
MKLRLLSIMMPVAIISGTADAAEIYNRDGNKLDLAGTIVGVHYFSNNQKADGDHSYMRFGFNGETQITDELTGYGRWQYQGELNKSEEEKDKQGSTLLGYAGLKYGKFGSFDYGRNFGVLYDVLAWTDIVPELGGDTYGVDDMMSNRGNGMATYRNRGFFGLAEGLNFALQYQGKNPESSEKGKGREAVRANGDGYGMSVSYDFGGGIGATGAFTSTNRTVGQRNLAYGHGGGHANAYAGALKYDREGILLAAMYTQSYKLMRFGDSEKIAYGFVNKARNVELVAQYTFKFGLRPGLAYVQARGDNIEGYGSQDLRKYIDISTSYSFNKNMLAFIDYQINLLKDNDFSRAAGMHHDNIVAVGMTYQF